MLDRFLVPLDTAKAAEQVLPYVSLLAKQLNQPVVLYAVVADGAEFNPVSSAYDAAMSSFIDERKEYAEKYLSGIKAKLEAEHIGASTDVAVGPVAESIVSAAASHSVGLIAMATHGRVGPERWFLGSVADKVVRTASIPVLLVRPREGTAPAPAVNSILVPTDGSDLAEKALPCAVFLAKAFNAPLTVVRTLTITPLMATGADPYMNDGGISPEVIDFMEEDIKAYLERTADHLRQQGVTVFTAYSMLPPDEELSRIAAGKPGALVVMTTHGRSGIGRAFLGSVTDRVIRSSIAPVLVVRG